jgi:hypothetical protein
MSWIFHEPFEGAVFARRRVYAPPVPRRSFRRPMAGLGIDLFGDEPWTAQRRAYAPVPVAVAAIRPFSPAGRVLASLLAADVFGEHGPPTNHTRLFPSGFAQINGDVGRSASFTVSVGGADASVTAAFAGAGDDPYGPIGLSIATGVALGADPFRELAVQNPAVFGGASASRTV